MKTAVVFSAALLAAVAGAALPSQARDLTVVGFGGSGQDAFREAYFKPFSQQTGIPLTEESWDGGVGVLRAKIEGGNGTWDVVQMDSSELAIGCEEGLYEQLDFSRIGGKDAYLPFAVSPCGAGLIVYDYVLAYDGDRLKDGPKSWADFFDTARFPGKRALRQGPQTNLEIALMADGVAPKDVYTLLATEDGVNRALRKLETIKKELVFWKAGAQPPQLLASGEVVMTTAYNGRISAAIEKEKKNFRLIWNQAIFVIDSWAILKGSPNIDKAYKFLEFVGRPEVQKNLPNHISYGITSAKGSALIDPARLANLPSAPQNMAVALPYNTEFWLEHTDRLTERFNNWAARL
ncbi:ABC transporter substrate-binding protein [Novispirillum itersonii]|uniref:Putative spermidine/putrescine transport system substrate-binding protein n=1 Tax=Novispirillum itersonii TaxID=189 RepID=A0A7W9ZJ12_NOVIT|nr:ABC transporter substrate-binding protein [Novispirillum itersonii]MBB6211154.1 putative spermidine/putrescine transport system substrate-binding protein [Novispirillum itersonii]